MIKRFHVLYVGQVELENIGLQGTPADARRYDNAKLSEPFFAARDVAQLMDDLGYHALWTAEHHFQHEGYECFPNLIQLSLWLATQTRRLKIGCAFNVLPMWHPIRIAEDYAMADIVTDGRVIMGVGRGYHSREVETFGAPVIDQVANRELFEEQVDLMLKCFNEESFSHHGKHYDCPPAVEYRGRQLTEITCVPRPKHLPVEIWMPIASSKSIDYMASKDFKAMITLNGEKILDDVIVAYRDACAKYGRAKQLGEDVIWGPASISPTRPRRPSAASSPRTTSATSGSRPSASSGTRTSRVARGARRARPHACRPSPTASSRRRGSAGRRARHRRHQVDRGEVSRARGLHGALGRRPLAARVHGAAALVRERRDAGVPAGIDLGERASHGQGAACDRGLRQHLPAQRPRLPRASALRRRGPLRHGSEEGRAPCSRLGHCAEDLCRLCPGARRSDGRCRRAPDADVLARGADRGGARRGQAHLLSEADLRRASPRPIGSPRRWRRPARRSA